MTSNSVIVERAVSLHVVFLADARRMLGRNATKAGVESLARDLMLAALIDGIHRLADSSERGEPI